MTSELKTLFVSRISPKGVDQFATLRLDDIVKDGGKFVKRIGKDWIETNQDHAEGLQIPYKSYTPTTLDDVPDMVTKIVSVMRDQYEVDDDSILKTITSNLDLCLNKSVRDSYGVEKSGGRGRGAKIAAASKWVMNLPFDQMVEIAKEANEILKTDGQKAKDEFILARHLAAK